MYKKLLMGSAILASTLTLQASELDDLNAKLDALTEEIAQIQEAKSDNNEQKFSIGGYGQVDYTNYLDSGKTSELDLYRAILYLGYQFTDDIKFVSEIEWEHGGRESTGGILYFRTSLLRL